MSYDFNADEVFKLAIRIEENGARFYRKAAEFQTEADNRAFLENLAAMEDVHKKMFEKMQSGLTAAEKTPTVFDPQGDSAQYLMAMADTHGGEGSPSAADALTGQETILEIIDTAIGLEKESILFYLGLKDLVPPKMGQEKVYDIIDEERRHIVQLNGFRRKLTA
jgi:rubrerythrin